MNVVLKLLCLFCLISLKCNFKNKENWDLAFQKANVLIDSIKYYDAILLLIDLEQSAISARNDSILAEIYTKIGGVYGRANSAEDNFGLEYFQKSLSIAESIDLKSAQARSHYGIGAAYQMQRKYDSSLASYYKAIPSYINQGDSATLSYLYSNLGLLYSKNNNFEKSETYFKRALRIQKEANDTFGMGASYSNLGLVHLEIKDLNYALDYFRKSSFHYKQASYMKGLAGTYRWMAVTFGSLNQFDSAGLYFLKYDSLDHDIFHQEYEGEIRNLKFQRDLARQEIEIGRNKFQLIILIVILLATLIITSSGYIFINQRRKSMKIASDQKIQDLLQSQEIKTAYALLEGQDKERKRIAIELHDNLGSILTSLNMFADALQVRKDLQEIKEIANRISDTSTLANEEIRKISHSLDSGLLKHFGLKVAIKQLTEAVETAKKITFELELQIDDNISNEKGLDVYRIIQELINNALKHAQCTKIHLEMTHVNKHLSIIFEDNGVGFEPEKVGKGMGLNNIYKRTQKLNGEFTIESKPEKGATFIVELPEL